MTNPAIRALFMAARNTLRMQEALLSLLAVVISFAAPPCKADRLPLWEVGAGAAAIDFPHYRGSDQRQTYVLPLPHLVYRGKLLEADRDGVRGLFFRTHRAELDVSLNGSIPVDSAGNRARAGMPDLDPTFEIGPSLQIALWRTQRDAVRIELRLPARTVVATDLSSLHNVGWVFQPLLNADLRETVLGPAWNLGLGAGPVFGDKRYHNYFYGVPADFATPVRPAYRAEGGYGGFQLLATASRRFGHWWIGGFARWDTLSGAVFEDSPLIRQNYSVAAGVALTRVLKRSSRLAASEK